MDGTLAIVVWAQARKPQPKRPAGPKRGTPSRQPPAEGPVERFGLVVTNLIKLGGLVFVFTHELTPEALGLAAFMLAGAQGIEQLFKGVFGK